MNWAGKPSLADLPDEEIDRLAALGFDHIWVMGVWGTGTAGGEIAQRQTWLRERWHELFGANSEPEIVGSPYAQRPGRGPSTRPAPSAFSVRPHPALSFVEDDRVRPSRRVDATKIERIYDISVVMRQGTQISQWSRQ